MPSVIPDISNPVLYADNTSLIFTNSDLQVFEKRCEYCCTKVNKWFHSNLLLLNLEKTYFLQFLTKNTKATDLKISNGNNKYLMCIP
jgi:hypothetical protein